MDRAPDPKQIKTLADILALVLVDQPGESMAALEAVRRRAKQDGVTGGALKELVHTLSNAGQGRNWTPPRASSTAQIDQLRTALAEAQRRFVETRLELDREKRDATILRRRLDELYAPMQRSRRTIAEAAWLRGRVTQLERQLDNVGQLQAELDELRATNGLASQPQHVARRRHRVVGLALRYPQPLTVIRVVQLAAGLLLLLCLVTDHRHFKPKPVAQPDGPPVIISV